MAETNYVRELSRLVEGDYESSQVHFYRSRGEPEEYPLVFPLTPPLDTRQLMADYETLARVLSQNYIVDRKDHLGVPFEQAQALLGEAGFIEGIYLAFGLMRLGTTELLNEIPDYTRSVFEMFPAKAYRGHYSTALPGWESSFHGDATHFREVGFRINLPLNVSAHYSFLVDGEQHDFELEPGRAWFVNFCRIHKGYNPHKVPRTCMIFQLDSDLWLPQC